MVDDILSFDELTKPDERTLGTVRNPTTDQLQEDIRGYTLKDNVPDDVKRIFEVSKNAEGLTYQSMCNTMELALKEGGYPLFFTIKP